MKLLRKDLAHLSGAELGIGPGSDGPPSGVGHTKELCDPSLRGDRINAQCLDVKLIETSSLCHYNYILCFTV